ncbi:MAG TPA: AraC family transcriptional regulator [Vicinamibacterales bacterium]|nr:AraC family transcriptional regulator [Vicinamibacterales bacterium]
MDPLSDVLRAVRLNGAYFYLVEASAPWSVAARAARELAPRILPESEHLISYHIVTGGSCWGGIVGQPQQHLNAGDVIVFPQGDPHVMASAEGQRVPNDDGANAPSRYPETVRLGDRADRETTFVCGFLGCDAKPFNPLLAALPKCLHVPRAAEGWLSEFPRQVVAESRLGRVGADTMLTRMAELMFIEVVRRYLEAMPPQQASWLAGLKDPVVGPAIACMHSRPAEDWTLASLAREAGASRSVLADRFSSLVGMPPMQYLTQWRIQLAASLLTSGRSKVSAVAQEIGYASEAAFSRAFKRSTGFSPVEFRNGRTERRQ